MAGVLERMRWSRKKTVVPMDAISIKVLELETAKEILAEVFRIRFSEVDEMIQSRYEAACYEDVGSKEDGLWPQEFWVEE